MERASPRTVGASPNAATAFVISSLEPKAPLPERALTKVFLLCENAALISLKKCFSSSGDTQGVLRISILTTALSTLGAGINADAGTCFIIRGFEKYCAARLIAPYSFPPGFAQRRSATYF